MCSLHLTHPSGAVGSRHCGARGSSVPCSRVSPQSWTLPAGAGIQTHNFGLPQVSSPTLYPLGHDCPNWLNLLKDTMPKAIGVTYCKNFCMRFCADVPALIEHRHRMVVRACSCGWEGWVRQGQMGCWWLPSLLVVYAEMTARSLPGQLQKQTGLTGHQLTCPLLLPRVQVKGESLCTPLILSTWQDPAVPHPALCRENFWKIIPVKKIFLSKNHYTTHKQHT